MFNFTWPKRLVVIVVVNGLAGLAVGIGAYYWLHPRENLPQSSVAVVVPPVKLSPGEREEFLRASVVDPEQVPPVVKEALEPSGYAAALSAERVAELGTDSLPPIAASESIYFIYGRYIEAPYVVSRKGAAILVNGYIAYTLPRFPPEHYLPDAPPLLHVNRDMCFQDLKVANEKLLWHQLKSRWIYWHHPDDRTAIPVYLKELQALPFVKAVSVDWEAKPENRAVPAKTEPPSGLCSSCDPPPPPVKILVETYRPECQLTVNWPRGKNREVKSQKEFIGYLNQTLKSRHELFLTDRCLFDGAGSLGSLNEDEVPYLFLDQIVAILESDLTEDEKLKQIYPYFAYGNSFSIYARERVDPLQIVIRTYRGSPELTRKLQKFPERRLKLGIRRPEDVWNKYK